MPTVSVLIPSRTEQYLVPTVQDVLAKATGDIEVIVVLEGYWPDPPLPADPRLVVLHHPVPLGMRTSLNDAASVARGRFLMKLDAHCLVAEGFDEVLAADCDDDWIVLPRRKSLEPSDWSIREYRPTVDYEYIAFPYAAELRSVKTSNKWHARMAERAHLPIDDAMSGQGSLLFFSRALYDRIGPFQTEGYGEFILDTEEFTNKTWMIGGRCIVNKHTFYAHLHKTERGYFIDRRPLLRGRLYHIDYWMHDRWPLAVRKYEWLIDHFWPVPTWPGDWRDPRYERAWKGE